ncbi:MAG: DUF3293 domain-containing protein [Salinisphaera sp.]|nr:DUF3293 domain-containing protein [Salinisphaera sp.]
MRHQALVRELRQMGLAFTGGIGQHPANHWPSEQSLLVFGLGLEAAKVLGHRHEQNAVVWNDASGTPALILLR